MRKPQLLIVALVLGAAVLMPTPAQAVGSRAYCHSTNYVSHTNQWGFFWNHNIRVYAKACRKWSRTHTYRYLPWVRRPTVSFTSRGRPSTERVQLTKRPYVSKIYYLDGRKHAVRYTFNVKSCSLYAICQDWEFYFYVKPNGTRICAAGGMCDHKKYW